MCEFVETDCSICGDMMTLERQVSCGGGCDPTDDNTSLQTTVCHRCANPTPPDSD
jgi:hypothetical protein